MTWRLKFLFLVTGLWLGFSQVGLTFQLLYSQGASVIFYFALVVLWLLGSIIALSFFNSKTYGYLLKILSWLLFLVTTNVCINQPFTNLSLVCVLSAVIVFGMFAGWFFKDSVASYKNIKTFLLYENNGFIMGYAISGLMLLYSVKAVNRVVLMIGLLLIIVETIQLVRGKRQPEEAI